MANSLLALLFLAIEIVLLPSTLAKKNKLKPFYYKLDEEALLNNGKCTFSGVRSVHLSEHASLNMRLHFSTLQSNDSIFLETFDGEDRRLDRIEVRFFQGHLQINHNGLLSPWIPAAARENDSNQLEITANLSKFLLNSRRIPIDYFEAADTRFKHPLAHDIEYDESAQPDDEWLDLFNDPEIKELLEDRIPQWKSPIRDSRHLQINSNERVEESSEPRQIEYIVYDSQNISLFEVTSHKHLPKLKKPIIKTQQRDFTRMFRIAFWNRESTQLAIYNTLPTKHSKQQIMGGLAIAGFIVYLLVLIRLSRMSSKRTSSTSPRVQQPLSITKTALISSHSQSRSHSHHLQSGSLSKIMTAESATPSPLSENKLFSKSSSSRVLSIDFSDAPQLKSTISTDGSVLRVTVPAALSLADNRHILFPSKLRSFQK